MFTRQDIENLRQHIKYEPMWELEPPKKTINQQRMELFDTMINMCNIQVGKVDDRFFNDSGFEVEIKITPRRRISP
jgi:hypothetical protein